MLGSTLPRLRLLLAAQAAVTGALAVAGPLDVDRWIPFVVGAAAGALVLAWFVGTRTHSAWAMTLAFEVLALAVGGTGAMNGDYVPGTLLGLAVLLILLTPAGRAAFSDAGPAAAAAPVRLTPPPVVTAPLTPAPAFPPPGLLVAGARPPAPLTPPPPGFSGSILPRG